MHVLIAALVATLFLSCGTTTSFQDGKFRPNRGTPPLGDNHSALARRYAPYIYHATDDKYGRQDVISNIDFDGDLIGNNNWENFELYELKPTVYYAVLETETHYFISYHLFHPRDWNHFTFWLHDTHENDGENLQVVVRKSDRRVALLWTQAHYGSDVYTNPGSGISSAKTKISAGLQIVNARGVPADTGTHAAVFVEAQGHGIFGTLDGSSDVTLREDGSYAFGCGSGLLFRPAREGEVVREPEVTTSGEVPYQLDSITKKLWPPLRDESVVGDGKLLDGAVRYKDALIEINVPRYYDADRYSGPFGPDRGISPFALDFSFSKHTIGALFFNPARRYPERLSVSDPWSHIYIDYPFK